MNYTKIRLGSVEVRMTCDQARAVLSIWGNWSLIEGVARRQIEELSLCMRSLCDAPVNINKAGCDMRSRRCGDTVGYKVGMAERFERRIKRLNGLTRGLCGIKRMVRQTLPTDSALINAIRLREITGDVWEKLGNMCGVDGAYACDQRRLILRRLMECQWSDREAAAVSFALRYIRTSTMRGPLMGAVPMNEDGTARRASHERVMARMRE